MPDFLVLPERCCPQLESRCHGWEERRIVRGYEVIIDTIFVAARLRQQVVICDERWGCGGVRKVSIVLRERCVGGLGGGGQPATKKKDGAPYADGEKCQPKKILHWYYYLCTFSETRALMCLNNFLIDAS